MLFSKKAKKEEKKLALLYPENVKVGCKADTKENVIRQVGQMLVDSGYVNPSYVDAMVKREESFSTYMGNELALPHGVEEAKKEIKASGIAGVGEEHLQILSVIAEQALEEGNMERIINGSAQEVYEILNLLVETVGRLRKGETPEQIEASGVDPETISLAQTIK